MPTDVEMPAPVNTAIFLLIPQEYHAVMSIRPCCGGDTRVFWFLVVFWVVGGLVGVVLVGCVWCFRHAGVWVCFVGFVGWWLGGWFAWVGLVVYVVLLLPLAGRLPLGGWFCRVCGGGLRTQERVCTTFL